MVIPFIFTPQGLAMGAAAFAVYGLTWSTHQERIDSKFRETKVECLKIEEQLIREARREMFKDELLKNGQFYPGEAESQNGNQWLPSNYSPDNVKFICGRFADERQELCNHLLTENYENIISNIKMNRVPTYNLDEFCAKLPNLKYVGRNSLRKEIKNGMPISELHHRITELYPELSKEDHF